MRRLTALLVTTLACTISNDIVEIEEIGLHGGGATPFERAPYVIAMSDSSAVVRWRTTRPSQPAFRFWGDSDTLFVAVPGPRRSHTVLLRDLEPSTTYTYQVLAGDTLWTEPIEIETFPEMGAKEPFTFIVFGDSGTRSTGQVALAGRLNEEEPDLVIHTGDVAYNDGRDRELTDNHFRVYAPLLARSPFFPSVGNHDLRTRIGVPFIEAFTPPGQWPTGSPFFYAFTVANVRFIALDTNELPDHDRVHGRLRNRNGEQYRWLVREIEAARADPDIDWIIPYFHHAPYSASTGWSGHGSISYVRDIIAPLADRYGLRLMFSGHDHDYQRSHPIREDRIAEDGEGTVYVVTGGGGGRWRLRGTGAKWFTAYSDQIHHYVRGHVEGDRIVLEAVNTDGEVFDTHVIESEAVASVGE